VTKAEIIEQAYLALHGGQPSPDVNVQRVDIENLLPAVVAEAVTIWTREDRREAMEDIRFFGGASGASLSPNDRLLVTKKVTPVEDAERELFYFDLPGRLQSMPANRGLHDVFPPVQNTPYQRVSSWTEIAGMPVYPTTFYWHENIEGVDRVFLVNLGYPVCDHYVRYVASITDTADSEELPVPEAMQYRVIQMLVDFFMKRAPEDEQMDADEER